MNPNFEGIDRTLAELRTLQQSHEESYEQVRTLLISTISELDACRAVIRMLASDNTYLGLWNANLRSLVAQRLDNIPRPQAPMQVEPIPAPRHFDSFNIPEVKVRDWYSGDRIDGSIYAPAIEDENTGILNAKCGQFVPRNTVWQA